MDLKAGNLKVRRLTKKNIAVSVISFPMLNHLQVMFFHLLPLHKGGQMAQKENFYEQNQMPRAGHNIP